MKKVVLKVDVTDDRQKRKIMKTLSALAGVESVTLDMKSNKLTVVGDVDPIIMVEKMRKVCFTQIISVGPAKEERKTKMSLMENPKDTKENLPTRSTGKCVKDGAGAIEKKFDGKVDGPENEHIQTIGKDDRVEIAHGIDIGSSGKESSKKADPKGSNGINWTNYPPHKNIHLKLVLRLEGQGSNWKDKIAKVVIHCKGLESFAVDSNTNKMTAIGSFDPRELIDRVKELKLGLVETISIGPERAIEPDKNEQKKALSEKDSKDYAEGAESVYYRVLTVEEDPNACIIS